ncbi:MAG: hypothetical protein AAF587_25935 [Bacteroidota bacterium]
MKQALILIAFLMSTSVFSQPSDAQIRQDINNPGVLSIELSKRGGSKVWSSSYSQYFWERGVIVYRNAKIAEYPNAKVEIGGLARYNIVGGKFSYNRFLVTWNRYIGIPTPSDKEILAMASTNLEQFVGNFNFNKIVTEVSNIRMADERKDEWHTPNSFSINLACSYGKVVSYTEVAQMDAIYRVRFYRDAITSPWKARFLSTNKQETETGRQTYNADEIRVMPTLGSRVEDQKAQAYVDGLPSVQIPQFQSDVEVFTYVHDILLNGTPEQFQAMMMELMAPNYFLEGSTVKLNQRGADLINHNMDRAYKGKSTYANQYCKDAAVKHRQKNMIQLLNKSKQCFTRIAVGQFGGRFERGVRVDQEYKITALDVRLLTRQVDLDYMNSFPEEEMCPGN